MVPLLALVLVLAGHLPSGPSAIVGLVPVAGAFAATLYARANQVPPHDSWQWTLPSLALAAIYCVASFAETLDPDPYFTQGPSSLRHSLEYYPWLLGPLVLPAVAALGGLAERQMTGTNSRHP